MTFYGKFTFSPLLLCDQMCWRHLHTPTHPPIHAYQYDDPETGTFLSLQNMNLIKVWVKVIYHTQKGKKTQKQTSTMPVGPTEGEGGPALPMRCPYSCFNETATLGKSVKVEGSWYQHYRREQKWYKGERNK